MGEEHPTKTEAEADVGSSAAKRPYRKPVLRRIGSVRQLTLGASQGLPVSDGASTRTRLTPPM